jgi:hypothetical protein
MLPACSNEFLFRQTTDYGIEKWRKLKLELPYCVYQLDKRYEENILKINRMIGEFNKIYVDLRNRVNNIAATVLYKTASGMEAIWASNSNIIVNNEEFFGRADRRLSFFLLFDELMQELKEAIKSTNSFKWEDANNSMAKSFPYGDSDPTPAFRPLSYQEFETVITEINRLIDEDEETLSGLKLLKTINLEANGLIKQLELELRLDDTSIGNKYGVAV